MSESESPHYRIGALWGILTLLLLVGTVAAAGVVYGLTDLYATGRFVLDVPIVVAGGIVALLTMLFVSGMLYRADRVRGVPHKEVKLFE